MNGWNENGSTKFYYTVGKTSPSPVPVLLFLFSFSCVCNTYSLDEWWPVDGLGIASLQHWKLYLPLVCVDATAGTIQVREKASRSMNRFISV
jgi:hypothetical protein